MASYSKITSQDEIKKLLQLVVDRSIPIRVAWRDNEEDQDFYVNINNKMFNKDNETFLIEVENLADLKYFSGRKNFMAFFVDAGAAYYCKFKISAEDPKGVVCKLPDLIFRVQRRRFYRVNVLNKGLKAGFNSSEKDSKGLIVRDVIDIGIGGCSVHINRTEAAWMKIGDLVKGFRLKLEPNLYISPVAAVRFVGVVTVSKGNKMLKCGIEFVKMSATDEKELSYRVYSMQRLESFKHRTS